jgi:hypothetical protein
VLALALGICIRFFANVLPAWCANIANCCYAVPKYCSLTLNWDNYGYEAAGNEDTHC